VKVLFIAPLPEPVTGQSLACRVFFDELRKHHDVELVNLSKRGFQQGVDSISRIFQIFRIVFSVWKIAKAADAIYFTISESAAGNIKDLLVYLVCFRRLSAMIIHLHGGAGMRGIMLGAAGFRRRLNEYFLRRIGGAVVLGAAHADIFVRALPIEKIHIVPNFAEDYLYNDAEHTREKFAQVTPLRVLFLSNLLPGKGYLELLDAIAMLGEDVRPYLQADFAGGFEKEQDKRQFLARIKLLPQVHYHGTVSGEKKRRLLSDAHLLCLPTYYPYEGQPICILEAYAAGCAVITTDHSGIRDIFSDGKNGLLVAKRSATDIKLALEQAVGEPLRLLQMALHNSQIAMSNYRTVDYCARLIHTVESLPKYGR
jgi:glycosyltransferase involved in cell wall biosynthesis